MFFQSDVVIESWVRNFPQKVFQLPDLQQHDLFLANQFDPAITIALRNVGILNPTPFDKSRTLQIALVAPGLPGAQIQYGAGAYRHALDIGGIG
jgi:hypothetical protein